jgi:hypothetical protein
VALALNIYQHNRYNKKQKVVGAYRLIQQPQKIKFTIMKKIFTLMAATFLTIAVFAADRKPVVTLKSSRNYEVIIDGQSYFSSNRNSTMSLAGIRNGQHSIKVYEISKSPFRKFKKLVSASSFQVKRNDIDISVNAIGQISITEDRFGRDSRDNGWDKKDDRGGYDNHDNDHRNDKNDRDKRF